MRFALIRLVAIAGEVNVKRGMPATTIRKRIALVKPQGQKGESPLEGLDPRFGNG